MNANLLLGYRKWSIGALSLSFAFTAALLGKLNTELAGVIASVAGGFFAANGFTTGKGREPVPAPTGSTLEE